MTSSIPGERPGEPLGFLIVDDGGPQRSVPIFDQMFVGRECVGISEYRRLVLRDPEISSNHLEIRLDAVSTRHSSSISAPTAHWSTGYGWNARFRCRSSHGDEIRIGDIAMTFRSQRFTGTPEDQTGPDTNSNRRTAMVMVVGDITNYSTISEVTDRGSSPQPEPLWHEVGGVLRTHRGTLNHYAGDAIYRGLGVEPVRGCQ